MSVTIDIAVETPVWEKLTGAEATALRALEIALRLEHVEEGEIAVILADDARVRKLNRDFRGIDKATNVLAFPGTKAPDDRAPLGDIVLAYETLAREAENEGKAAGDHLMHLVVHGTLHLLGYDHLNEADAEKMEARERAILAALGVSDPYAQREDAGANA